jgi:hypothetical protein
METGKLIVGTQAECKLFVRSRPEFYTYILRRPDGRPFYVGKGIGDRVFAHENEARHANDRRSNAYKLNVIRSIWKSGDAVSYEIDLLSHDEDAVHARETLLIGRFKRLHEGGPLTNLAAGGGSLSGSAPISKERHTATLSGLPVDNPERATLNSFVLNIAPMRSVVLKPVSQFATKATQRYPGKSMAPTVRQAVALVAAASSNGVFLDDACSIPRTVVIDGVPGFVENGVACDILTSGMANVVPAPNPADEIFQLSAAQARTVVGLVGLKKCVDLGVVESRAIQHNQPQTV